MKPCTLRKICKIITKFPKVYFSNVQVMKMRAHESKKVVLAKYIKCTDHVG